MPLFRSTCNVYCEQGLGSKVGHLEECRLGRDVCSVHTYTEFISIKRSMLYIW